MDENIAIAGAIGFFFKHIVASRKVNRVIPIINYAAMLGLNAARGMDIGSAAGKAVTDVLMAMGAHKTAKTTLLGDAAFIPGYDGVKNKL